MRKNERTKKRGKFPRKKKARKRAKVEIHRREQKRK